MNNNIHNVINNNKYHQVKVKKNQTIPLGCLEDPRRP